MKNKRDFINNSKLRIILIYTVLSVLLVTGCRPSDNIVQTVYDQNSDKIDHNHRIVVTTTDKDKDNDLKEQQKDQEADRDTDTENIPDNSEKNKDNKAPEADKSGGSKESGGGNHSGSGEDENNDSDNSGGGDASATENPDSRQYYDAGGNLVELPEKVESVAAAGDAAVIAAMLAGGDIVKGTSSDLKKGIGNSVFGFSETETLWQGDGLSPMSDTDFNRLLEIKPDACLEISGAGSFTGSQISKLKEKKIAYIVIPPMNSTDNINAAVSAIASVIGTDEAAQKADKYKDYCKSTIREVSGKTGVFNWNGKSFKDGSSQSSNASKGRYTLYISDWAEDTFTLSSSSSTIYSSTGIAVAPSGYGNSPLSYLLSMSGVCNNGARFTNSSRRSYYAIPFNVNNYEASAGGSSGIYPDKTESFVRAYAGADSIDEGLGDERFTKIIAADKSIKRSIENSDMWRYTGRVTLGNITDYGRIIDGNLVISYVRSSKYKVIVNPYGVCSWADGSVESILEMKWASWQFNDKYTESDVRNSISDFYSSFYGYSLSDSQISSILSGR